MTVTDNSGYQRQESQLAPRKVRDILAFVDRLWTYFHAIIFGLLAQPSKVRFVLNWKDIDAYIRFVSGPHIGRHPDSPPLHLVMSAEREARREIHQMVRRQGMSMSQAMSTVCSTSSVWQWHFFQPWQDLKHSQMLSQQQQGLPRASAGRSPQVVGAKGKNKGKYGHVGKGIGNAIAGQMAAGAGNATNASKDRWGQRGCQGQR